MKPALTTLIFILNLSQAKAFADYMGPKAETKTLQVDQCSIVYPEKVERIVKQAERCSDSHLNEKYKHCDEDREKLMRTYRGIMIQSNKESFFYQTDDNKICDNFVGTKITVNINSAYCDGDPNPPCYLGIERFISLFER